MNYLILVNKKHAIKENYLKKVELVDYFNVLNESIKVEKKTLESYLLLKEFLEKKDIFIGIDSSYRTIEEQQKNYDEFMIKYGEEYTKQIVAPIKTSEHHTGLAIDLVIKVNDEFLMENEDLMANEDIFLEDYIENFSGVLVVNKEKNMTSRDVVNEVSKILGIKKIGHTGTLDPMAEGVLVLTIGKATKIGELLVSLEKEYIASVETGKLTDTLDITGKILCEKEVSQNIDYEKLLKTFKKRYLQEVPIYSAVKVNGKKLYEYARNNKEVILPKKEVEIKEIELLDSEVKKFKFRCLVSKGTYIRSLIRDMGKEINEYFSMSSLIRTKQGRFSINNSYTLEDIRNNKFKILSIKEVLNQYPLITMDDKLYKLISNGVKIENRFNIEDKVLFQDKNNKLIAIYQKENKLLKICKMINEK